MLIVSGRGEMDNGGTGNGEGIVGKGEHVIYNSNYNKNNCNDNEDTNAQ